MRSVQEILAILRRAMPELARDFSVTRVALFGSYARGQQTETSDVDILVEVDPAIGLRFVDLAERIESLIGVRADVVSRRAISERHWAVIEEELVDVA
jgi:predicted nucleotidyltransferase